LLVDFSTIPVDACRDHAARLAKQTGCRWVDRGPSRAGPPAAAAGTLTVMAGEPRRISRASRR